MDRKRIAIVISVLLALSPSVEGGEISKARAALDKWAETFGIERPWDALPSLSDSRRRHRGALAHVYHTLKHGQIPEEACENLYRDLGNLLALKNANQVIESGPAFSNYQASFQINVFQLWQQLITEAASPVQWNTAFKEAYYSPADGTGIPFKVHLPPAITDQKTYPVLVVLKGGLKVNPGPEFPFIQVNPSRGGIWGYRAISGYDVMQVIAFMKRYYPVDPDRIYLVGFSAGASAAMHLASSYPDAFAAVLPMVAVGTDFPSANFKNLPVAIHHGTDDWTSSICNARVQYQKMQTLGCPVILKEYPTIGHSVPKPHEPIARWLLENTRNQSPPSLTHQCETPALGRAYWIHIREFQDPHQRAFVEASVDSSNGTVRIRPRNIQSLTINLNLLPLEKNRIKTIEIGENRFLPKGATKRLDCRFQGGRWQMVSNGDSIDPPRRPYHAGAAANLYQGDPLLIVYGTGTDQPDRANQLQSAAQKLSACGGPVYYPMQHRFPVVADTALTSEQEANCNLMLIGVPDENSVTQSILPDLPIAIHNDTLVAADRSPMPLKNQVLSLLYPHPKYPKRLVYLITPFTDPEGMVRFCEAPQRFLVGSEGFDRISQADLAVQNLDHQIGRQMQFDKNWNWITLSGAHTQIPTPFGDRTNLAMTYLKIMRQKSGADFAFWWGPADQGIWGYDFNFLKRYNPDVYTQADFRTQHHRAETMTGSVSGIELKEIWNRWGQNKQLLSVPQMQMDTVADQKHYRIHIPMDLYIKLGQRKKALDNPKPGPSIASEEAMAEIFQTAEF